jgi:hypothetical protein
MDLENDFENLGTGSYSIEEFSKWVLKMRWVMIIPELEAGGFYKGHW